MAQAARRDQEARTVEVNRSQLLNTLLDNKEKHLKEYQEAVDGYKRTLLAKIESAYASAKATLDNKYNKIRQDAEALDTIEAIEKQNDYVTFLERLVIDMKVPRSYAKEYDAAIAIAHWDIRDVLELTHAEFTCFVQDMWDWKSDFDTISTMYKLM